MMIFLTVNLNLFPSSASLSWTAINCSFSFPFNPTPPFLAVLKNVVTTRCWPSSRLTWFSSTFFYETKKGLRQDYQFISQTLWLTKMVWHINRYRVYVSSLGQCKIGKPKVIVWILIPLLKNPNPSLFPISDKMVKASWSVKNKNMKIWRMNQHMFSN